MVKQSQSPAFTTPEAQDGTAILPATYDYLDNSAQNQSDQRPTYTADDSDYNTLRKYDLTPILLSNPTLPKGRPFGQDVSAPPYQSAQNKGQYIYSRFKDVSSEEVFYNYINPNDNFTINLDRAENIYSTGTMSGLNVPNEFIWGGGFIDPSTPMTQDQTTWSSTGLDVHIEHPYVKNYAALLRAYQKSTVVPGANAGDAISMPALGVFPYDATITGAPLGAPSPAQVIFRQSKFSPLQSDEAKGKTQNIYLNENLQDFPNPATPGSIYPGTLSPPSGGVQPFQASPSLNVANLQDVDSGTGPSGFSYARNVKTSFSPLDQFLLGQESCGSYLFIAPDDHAMVQVNGESNLSTKDIVFGAAQSLNIPLTFQYRMTDYYGAGSGSAGGRGNIVGDNTGATVNVTYAKRLGFDIYTTLNDVFQFDVELFATYKSDKLNINVFPSATISQSLSDLEKVVSNLTPSVTQTKVNQATTSTTGTS